MSVKSETLLIGQVCIAARLVFVFCCALTTGYCNVFHHIFVNQQKAEFYDPNFQTMLLLVTMFYYTSHQTSFHQELSRHYPESGYTPHEFTVISGTSH